MAKVPPWVGPSLQSTKPVKRITPTEDERKNGWDEETLSQYLHEREEAQGAALDFTNRRKGPVQAVGPRWNFPAKKAWTVGKSRWTVGRRGNR